MTKTRENVMYHHLDTFKNFENFFDTSLDLLCVAGFDGYFKRINPAVSKLLEYSTEELLSKPINEFIYHDDKDKTSLARNELRNRIPLLDFENRYLTKSGEIVWLLWTSVPVEKEGLVYAIAKNITHRKELEQERKFHLAELTKINNEFKQLTYSTAHDLRSPVNNMLSVFELLDTTKINDPETLEYISILKSITNNLKQSLNESVINLNLKNDSDAHIEKIDLKTTLNEVLQSINSLIQNSQAIIKIDFSEVEKIDFNKVYLKSIFLNLITNSIKYSKKDILPEISISTKKNNGTQLIISDNGIGFDMEKVKNKIFGLHQKFHNHNDSNGIGLYLVYNYITDLGGHITLESEENKGAKFIITFKE